MKKWTRAIGAAALILTLHAAAPARAEIPGAPPQSGAQTLPLPPSGTKRMIRIGPQALVQEDDHGRVKMADEPTTQPRPGRSFIATSALFGILGVGAYLMLQGAPGVSLDLSGPQVIR
jgi:hypothetical protein